MLHILTFLDGINVESGGEPGYLETRQDTIITKGTKSYQVKVLQKLLPRQDSNHINIDQSLFSLISELSITCKAYLLLLSNITSGKML